MPPASRRKTVVTATAANLLTLAIIAAGLSLGPFLPHGPFTHGPGLAGQIINMDGIEYRSIATTGYQWNPSIGGVFPHGQNMAFFPAFPLLLAAIGRIVPLTNTIIAVTGLVFGLFANAAFARLAAILLPAPQARTATLCFAAWPAIVFLVMGYPAGLIDLCVFTALRHHIQRRPLRAALWCGLGTAAAPQVVFIAAAFCLDLCRIWLTNRPTGRAALNNLALGALSVWGLLAFMLYQTITFKSPFAFLVAQRGFAQMPPFIPHLLRMVSLSWYALPFSFTRLAFTQLIQHQAAPVHLRENFVVAAQLLLSVAATFLTAAGVVHAIRKKFPPVIPLAAATLLAGYLWFVATGTFLWLCGPRMLQPAAALFLLIGATPRPTATITALAVLSFAASAVIAAGYGII